MFSGTSARRGRTFECITVADAMHEGVFSCTRDTSLSTVAEIMAGERVHCVIVWGDAEVDVLGLWGVVSDLDLVAAALVRPLHEQSAGGTAATPVVLIRPDEPLTRAAQLMIEHSSPHLVVVDLTRAKPLGVLSTLDVATALSRADQTTPAHP
jgi:CBS domain-containing protein